MLKVLIVDDSGEVRRGITDAGLTDCGIEIVGEANSADDALRLVGTLCPDLVLCGSDASFIKNAQKITQLFPDTERLKNLAVKDLFLGLFATENEIRDRFKALGLDASDSGSVIYCCIAGQNPPMLLDSLRSSMLEALNESDAVCCTDRDSFIAVSKLKRVNTVRKCLSPAVKEFERRHDVLVGMGVAPFTALTGLSGAYKEAVAFTDTALLSALSGGQKDRPGGYKRIVADALKLVSDNYNKALTVKWMAEKLYVSESHLMHIFKSDIGKTFNEYLSEFRVNMAKKLMLSHNYKVYEVAQMVGVPDSKYFGQVFKKVTGVTPSEFIIKER